MDPQGPAQFYDGNAFQHLVNEIADQMLVLSDTSFKKVDWHPTNLKICQRDEWNDRMVVETVLSMLTYICDFKHSRHKVWNFFQTKLGFTMALFNILVQWFGLPADEDGFVPLSIAQFSL